jgi:hypothetical protein
MRRHAVVDVSPDGEATLDRNAMKRALYESLDSEVDAEEAWALVQSALDEHGGGR